jgi:hypothetical protein
VDRQIPLHLGLQSHNESLHASYASNERSNAIGHFHAQIARDRALNAFQQPFNPAKGDAGSLKEIF